MEQFNKLFLGIDLALVLVILLAVSGLIWLLDSLLWAPTRRRKAMELAQETGASVKDSEPPMPILVDLARSLFPIFLIVLLLRSFLFEPFRIPSNSMMPTLLTGDFILVNKFDYGIRLPVLNTKILNVNEPQRGDIIVFRYPEDPSIPFIKRVVGLPGDRILYNNQNKTLYINDEPVSQNNIGFYQGFGSGSNMTGAQERLELLPPATQHAILVFPSDTNHGEQRYSKMVVPEASYFVLGDNRDNSRDSRYWGVVPEANLVGKAFLIWMHWDIQHSIIRWERIGTWLE